MIKQFTKQVLWSVLLGSATILAPSCSKNQVDSEVVPESPFDEEKYLDRTGWMVNSSSLPEASRPGSNVLDGDKGSYWHTSWTDSSVVPPHFITIKTGSSTVTARGITLLPRPQETPNGKIKKFTIEISSDNKTWSEVYTGEMAIASIAQTFRFNGGAKVFNYIKLTSYSDHKSERYASLAEIDLNP